MLVLQTKQRKPKVMLSVEQCWRDKKKIANNNHKSCFSSALFSYQLMTSASVLPGTLRSVYRLFLRASSASVLHHRVACANLRRLLRPTFDAAADVSRQIQVTPPQNVKHEAELRAWLDCWEKRMDNTLRLLYISSQSRGLPHKLIRNLGFLVLSEHQRLIKDHPKMTWQPTKVVQRATEEKRRKFEEFVENAWAPLSQVVKLAEGRDGISLGRVTVATRALKRRFK